MTANTSSRLIPPPRHGGHQPKKKIETYQQLVAQAERQYGEMIDKLNAEYLRILDTAGNNFAHAAERAIHIYNAIEHPARAVYDRQLKMAEDAYTSIMDPADAELKRLSTDAEDMYKRAIAPIEAAYQRALAEAQAVTQGMTLTTTGQ